MVSALRTIWPLMVAILLMSIGNGLQGSLIGVQAAVANFSSTTTGIIASGCLRPMHRFCPQRCC